MLMGAVESIHAGRAAGKAGPSRDPQDHGVPGAEVERVYLHAGND